MKLALNLTTESKTVSNSGDHATQLALPFNPTQNCLQTRAFRFGGKIWFDSHWRIDFSLQFDNL